MNQYHKQKQLENHETLIPKSHSFWSSGFPSCRTHQTAHSSIVNEIVLAHPILTTPFNHQLKSIYTLTAHHRTSSIFKVLLFLMHLYSRFYLFHGKNTRVENPRISGTQGSFLVQIRQARS